MSPALRPETAFTRPPSRRGVAGWLGSASVAALLMSGLAALAMSVAPSGESMADEEAPMMLTLPPAAPNLAALSDAAPETAPDAPEATVVPEPEAQPDLPDMTEAVPDVPDPAIRPPDPVAEEVPVADEAPPQPAELAVAETQPEPDPMTESPKPVARPKKPEQKFVRNPPEEPVEKAEKKPVEKKKTEKKPAQVDKETSKASAAASPNKQTEGAVSTGQGQSAAKNYGASVKKKILKTRRKTPSGKGTVTISFSIAADGGLVSVKVMNSSGSAEVDKTAINHIQRAAPFAPPPPGAETNYSWEFIYN